MHACAWNCAKSQYNYIYGVVAHLKLRLIQEGCLGMRLVRMQYNTCSITMLSHACNTAWRLAVVEGLLDLIADTSKSGAALMVNKEQGLTYVYT